MGEGRLHRVRTKSELVATCTFQRIRIVGACGRTWHVDPDSDSISDDLEWRLWAWESRPLARVQWDPGERQWCDPFATVGSPPTPFFQYSARLGRHILVAQRQATPAAAEHWRRRGITSEFLASFWKRLWSSPQPQRTVTFQSLKAHRAIAVVPGSVTMGDL